MAVMPVLAALAATFCYAVSSVYIKLTMAEVKPLTLAAGGQLVSALVLLPLALFTWPAQLPSTQAWACALLMGLFSTALALTVFFHLLQKEGVTRTIAVTYLIPVFGLLWGYLLLDETLTPTMMAGAALVLLGVALTTGAFNFLKSALAAKHT
jgi:drug/metabolite transporter (DMT)-like permease